jgi:transcriptional regulator GlxA family with amidase domain
MMSFAAATEPLRAANRLSGRQLYSWQVISAEGRPVPASSGIDIVADRSLEEVGRLDTLFVVAGLDAHKYQDRQVFARLRRISRSGCRIGAMSTGSYMLARAGLLTGYRATIHWENAAAFREAFPDIVVSEELFEIDRDRLTCSGGTASLDLMLYLIDREHGRELATKVAEQFIHERIRDTHDHQRMALRNRLGISHPKMLAVIGDMEQHLEHPLPRAELAERAKLSTRQLERLFRQNLNRTPTRYYLELRLLRARHLLTESTLSILDVALACGFVSASHFSKCYRECFGKTPREERLRSA